MRYKYIPKPAPVPVAEMNYIAGYLQSFIVDENNFIDGAKLYPHLKKDAYEVSEALAEILDNPSNWVPTGEVTEYALKGGRVDELIVVNKTAKKVAAIYTTMVGGGDDPGSLVAASLSELANQMQGISGTRAELISQLDKILDVL
jgi:hypothetical protein